MRDLKWIGGVTRQQLTKKEKRLLTKMMEAPPGETITETCRKAKTSVRTYYRLVNNPSLGSLLPESIDFLLSQQLVPLIQSIMKKAISGSAKHSELILKISGLISEDGTKILQVFQGKDSNALLSDGQIKRLLGE